MDVPREESLAGIEAYKRIGPLLATAGQPLAGQFPLIAQAGFSLVVNLATLSSSNAIPGEPEIVRALGLKHIHIPVIWKEPEAEDFAAWEAVMEANAGRAVFLHCAKNWRVSFFLFLRRVLRENADPEAAIWDVREIWEPDEVWTAFGRKMFAANGRPVPACLAEK